MPEAFSYLHPTKDSESLFKDRGSKFYGYCRPVKTEEEVKKGLEQIGQIHPQARHICYAYALGPEHEKYRVNDDGEPANSAGMPIYNQIKSHEITNVLIAVVRYFGGTKLGVPGLINAYKTAAEEAIDANQIKEHFVHSYYEVSYDYTQMDAVMHLVKINNWNVINQTFELDCKLNIEVEPNARKKFESAFAPHPEVEVRHLYNA